VALDNFFSSIDLFTALKALGVRAVKTTKQGPELLNLEAVAHWLGEAQKIVSRDLRSRHHIPEDFVQLDSENNQFLPFPRAVVDYNLHMGGVDGNAQQREQYSPAKHRCRRYWWSLFLFHLDAAVLNAYILYKLSYPTSKVTRARFRKEVATSLMRNPAGSIRKRPYDFSNSNPSIPPSAPFVSA